jgi:ABC-type multidrug transport system fused ATPase/permease subunit
VMLEQGRAAEAGDHDSLVATGGAYARLVGMQERTS